MHSASRFVCGNIVCCLEFEIELQSMSSFSLVIEHILVFFLIGIDQQFREY